jgi:hypothetical protein
MTLSMKDVAKRQRGPLLGFRWARAARLVGVPSSSVSGFVFAL